MSGEILVVKRNVLFKDGEFNGFLNVQSKEFMRALLNNYEYRERNTIEKDSNFQQPIPYVWLVNSVKKQIFGYYRVIEDIEDGKEKKAWTCGIGDHVPKDSSVNPLFNAMVKNLQEWLIMDEYPKPKIVGYIKLSGGMNDFHVGIVGIADTIENVKPVGNKIMDGKFYSLGEVERMINDPDAAVDEWTKVSWPFVKKHLAKKVSKA